METQNETIKNEKLRDSFVRSYFNIAKFDTSLLEQKPLNEKIAAPLDNASIFKQKLLAVLVPNLPAKELIDTIIKCALEVEFGKTFVLSKGFDKISAKIANSIMTNPTLRRQILAVTKSVLENKTQRQDIN